MARSQHKKPTYYNHFPQFTSYIRCACSQGGPKCAARWRTAQGQRGRGLRPHGGDDHVAFAAHHRRHTSACPALCARSAQSRAHTLPLPTPQALRPPSLLKAPLRRASPTRHLLPPFPKPPPTPRESLVSSVVIALIQTSPLSDGRRSLHAPVASENDHERPPRCSWPNLSPR